MDFEYDSQADAYYLTLASRPLEGSKPLTTVEVDNNLILDLNKDGEVFGVEVLGASETLGAEKPTLDTAVEALKQTLQPFADGTRSSADIPHITAPASPEQIRRVLEYLG